MARPILKWIGSKAQLLKYLQPMIPTDYKTYYEPFIGGGSLFFALSPTDAVISDINEELLNVYRMVATNVDGVIAVLKKPAWRNDEATYYSIRALRYGALSPTVAAARTIYLNKTCFNGLYRVNQKGEFNAAFGHYKNPCICDEENLHHAANVLKNVRIQCGDYNDIINQRAKEGDLVFMDPPYCPISRTANFTHYTKNRFDWGDQIRVAQTARRLRDKGVYVIATNSANSEIYKLYSDFYIRTVASRRQVSCHADTRKGQDVIITSFEIGAHYEIPKF